MQLTILSNGCAVKALKDKKGIFWFVFTDVCKVLNLQKGKDFSNRGILIAQEYGAHHLHGELIADSALIALHNISDRGHWIDGRRLIAELLTKAAQQIQ